MEVINWPRDCKLLGSIGNVDYAKTPKAATVYATRGENNPGSCTLYPVIRRILHVARKSVSVCQGSLLAPGQKSDGFMMSTQEYFANVSRKNRCSKLNRQ
ncbi:unnamed protein product [Protopolystoma xenopodis]|uniref:Uncharacterized protein n=1 Tax=Protopolystoma xenopodis TaxID=117903 RepID=A0A3S5AJH0_9PLAT|nr:unnamed protein product [Protopolystoma xenopodis]